MLSTTRKRKTEDGGITGQTERGNIYVRTFHATSHIWFVKVVSVFITKHYKEKQTKYLKNKVELINCAN